MHRANLNDMARLFALQYAVSTTSGHSRNVQKLGTVDHVIVCSSLACRFSRRTDPRVHLTFTTSNAYAFRFDLEA
jgi:hypothetical protein